MADFSQTKQAIPSLENDKYSAQRLKPTHSFQVAVNQSTTIRARIDIRARNCKPRIDIRARKRKTWDLIEHL